MDRAAVGEGTAEPPEAASVVEFAGETAVAPVFAGFAGIEAALNLDCLLYTSPSPRD